MVTRQGYEFPAITELPSLYFHRNVFLTFIEEPTALERLRDVIGVENIMWSTDYPHPVTSWPNSRKHHRGAVRRHPGRRARAHALGERRPGLEPVTPLQSSWSPGSTSRSDLCHTGESPAVSTLNP